MAARTLKTFLIDGGHCQPRHRTKERDTPALGTGGSSWRRCSWLLRFSVFVETGNLSAWVAMAGHVDQVRYARRRAKHCRGRTPCTQRANV